MKIHASADRDRREETVELPDGATARQLLEKLDINPVEVILSRDNELITDDEELRDNDTIKILSVISGG